MSELIIKNLFVSTDTGLEILKGISLSIHDGDMVALLGPNGHGKSTLLNAIMGHPRYVITKGTITFDGKDLLKMSVDERARAGLFLGMQNPSEIPGVINAEFLKAALNAKSNARVSFYKFYSMLNANCKALNFSTDMLNRSLNDGFSGGEKKRNEILQMNVLEPSTIMLDEIDSGLDVDAINLVSTQINNAKNKGATFIIISHYARLFDLIKPNRAIVIVNGQIAIDGGSEVVSRIDKEGFEWIETELGISIKKALEIKPVSIETCAVKEGLKANGK
ncbi:MAG: Fe-S cluster assembly ATPase SufC [Bacilli bacterium]